MALSPSSQQAVPSPEPRERDFRAEVLLGASLAIGLALRLWLAFNDDGVYWPDEIFQSLEPAHQQVFGYGLIPWEFVEGARNWALPGAIAAVLKICSTVGLDHPRQYLGVVRGLFAVGGTATALGCYRLARAYQARPLFAAAAAALFCGLAPAIYFAPRAMSETAAALPATFGLALALDPRSRRSAVITGASLLGLSVMLRLQCGVFCVGLLAILLARKRYGAVRDCALTLGVFAFLFGLLDHLTWAQAPGARFDGWFHSALKYLQFNLIENRASGWGVSPWSYYLQKLANSSKVAAVPLFGLSLLAFRRARGLVLLALLFLALHSAIGHKELRFLFPLLPLLCALTGIGLGCVPPTVARWALLPLTLASALWSAATFHQLTFRQVGQYPERGSQSAYDDFGPVNRMLLAAHDQADLCGVRIDAASLAWTGGASYLHRKVPLYHLGRPPVEAGTFNYVIARARPDTRGVVARDRKDEAMALIRVRDNGCIPDPEYRWLLP